MRFVVSFMIYLHIKYYSFKRKYRINNLMTILQTDLNDSVKKKLQFYYFVNTPTQLAIVQ